MYICNFSTQKGYILYDLKTHDISVSRDVIFHENIFPLEKSNGNTSQTKISSEGNTPQAIPENIENIETPPLTQENTNNQNPTSEDETTISEINQETLKKPEYLSDYFCSFATNKGIPKGTSYPMQDYITYKRLSNSHTDFFDKISITHEPNSYNQAKLNQNWVKAMNEELSALELSDTWKIVPKSSDRKIIGSRWVYKIKHKSNGDIERLKAILVARGHTQIEGFDYNETFSSVAKIVLIRTLLAVASIKNWYTFQMDVSNVFLHGNLIEEIFINLHQAYYHLMTLEFVNSKNPYMA